jgi:predicted metal-dependent peptidase
MEMTAMQKTKEPSSLPEKAAGDILRLCEDSLLVNLRFLKQALYRLQFCPDPRTTLATDGQNLFYGFQHIIICYRIQKELVVHSYLHTVFHCILHHPFAGRLVDRLCWDLACDIAAEAAIAELDPPVARCGRTAEQRRVLDALASEIGFITAEKTYRYYRSQALPPEELEALRAPFLFDEHEPWYQLSEHEGAGDSGDGEKQHDDEKKGDKEGGKSGDRGGEDKVPAEARSGERAAEARLDGKQAAQWKEISSGVQAEYASGQGNRAGSLLGGLLEANREKVDYRDFLARFAVNSEQISVNDDEFDYVFYTYGLALYGNMPLVEPLEYRESKRLREFVIAIDTSASVQGELVRKFISKTWNILKQTGAFLEKICVYIIQCDAQIQEVKKITDQDDFDRYMGAMQLRGSGGTDFRPVFDFVEELTEKKELTEWKGLIYFTDGDGVYPARRPPYDTAFVFVDNEAPGIHKVPVWAIRVALTSEDIFIMEAEETA